MSDAGIACAFVPPDRVSRATGYGPGGHPRPARRDGTLARENTDLARLLAP